MSLLLYNRHLPLLLIRFPLYIFWSFYIITKKIVLGFIFKVDDGGDEEETNMRNGGDRGKSKYMLIVS